MSTVAEITAAAAQLDPDEFVRLRQELERLEQELWERELARVADATQGLTDEEIDQKVLRRRREGRP